MDVTFDPAKDSVNMAKHGTSLADAAAFEWADAVLWPDQRRDYGEARMVALGYIGLRLMVVVFVDRPIDKPTERRIISLRRANTREVKRYAET
ncbi:MAG: BrnT family toxin [Polaromonas sp.]